MSGSYPIADQVLVIEGFFKILINVAEVGVKEFYEVVQLATDTAG